MRKAIVVSFLLIAIQVAYCTSSFSYNLGHFYSSTGFPYSDDTTFCYASIGCGCLSIGLIGAYQSLFDDFWGFISEDKDGKADSPFGVGLQLGYAMDQWRTLLRFSGNVAANSDPLNCRPWKLEAEGDYYYKGFIFSIGGSYINAIRENGNVPTYCSNVLEDGNHLIEAVPIPDKSPSQVPLSSFNLLDLWTVNAGISWQALPTTKLTFNYWCVGAVKNGGTDTVSSRKDGSIGHEFDFYLDQKILEGLKLRLAAAYLVAKDGLSSEPGKNDAYELGAKLQWSF